MQCIECGKGLNGRQTKFCSVKCKQRLVQRERRRSRKTHIHQKACEHCGVDYRARFKKQKYCSNKCVGKSRRKYLDIPQCLKEAHRKLDKNIGYVRIYCPMHPEANTRGYVYEHRVIAEKMIGRRLKKGEVVHHKNRKRWDNRPENLEVMDKRAHGRISGQRSKAAS